MCKFFRRFPSLFILFLVFHTNAIADCFPVPPVPPQLFGLACTLGDDAYGTGPSVVCGVEDVHRDTDDGGIKYRIVGKCEHKLKIEDSFGGDFGDPISKEYFFEGKAISAVFQPITSKNVQESVNVYGKNTGILGKIQGQYTCQTDPIVDFSASCTTDDYSSTLNRDHILHELTPFLKGMGMDGENVGTAQDPLKSPAPSIYAGIFTAGKDGYYLWRAKGWSNFVNKWKELSAARFRLTDIETFKAGNNVHFAGVWRSGKDGHYLWHAKGWNAFVEKWRELNQKGLRLTSIETYRSGNQRYFVGVWRAGKDAYYLWNATSWQNFTDKWQELAKKNYRLVDIETYRSGHNTHYLGVWREGRDKYYLWGVYSWQELVDKWEELAPKNYRLIDLDLVKEGNKTLYTGVWRAGSQGYALWRSNSWDGFVSKWKELSKKNLRLVSLDIM